MVAVGRNIRRKIVKIATRQIDHPFVCWVNTVEAMDIAVKKCMKNYIGQVVLVMVMMTWPAPQGLPLRPRQ